MHNPKDMHTAVVCELVAVGEELCNNLADLMVEAAKPYATGTNSMVDTLCKLATTYTYMCCLCGEAQAARRAAARTQDTSPSTN